MHNDEGLRHIAQARHTGCSRLLGRRTATRLNGRDSGSDRAGRCARECPGGGCRARYGNGVVVELPVAGDATATVERLLPAAWSREHEARAHVIPLTNAVGLPAVAVAVEASRLGLLTIGLAARPSAEQPESALDIQDPHGGFWRTYKPGQGNGAVRPVRGDRRYLDSHRADFRDVTDLFCQLHIQLDPRSYSVVQGRLGDRDQQGMTRMPRFQQRDYREYVSAITGAGFEPVAVDLTTPDVAAAGWHVRRAIVPGLVPNFPTAFPPLGRRMRPGSSLAWI